MNDETEFKLYVWIYKKIFYSICFFYSNGKSLKDQDYFSWKEFTHPEFVIGVFTDGNVECRDFEYCELDEFWYPEIEPEIKVVNKIVSKDFFYKPQNKPSP